jgi:hypothetical protein
MKIRTKQIGAFLKSLEPAEVMYMKHSIDFRTCLESMIREHSLTDEFLCYHFQISKAKLKDFVLGNYNYKLSDMSDINALYVRLEKERLDDKAPIQVAKK